MKTKKQFLHIFAVLGLLAGMLFGAIGIRPAAAAPTELGPGDIAIVGFSKVGDVSNFAFVLLVDIETGTQIRFTDAGWTGTGFHDGEGAVTYTAPGNLLAGTVIGYTGPGGDFAVTVEGPFYLTGGIAFTNAGDQLLAFQGSYASPIFLYALNNDDAGLDDLQSLHCTENGFAPWFDRWIYSHLPGWFRVERGLQRSIFRHS
jgi:hypothetical protein